MTMLPIAKDKKLHFAGGAIIGTVFSVAVSPAAGVVASALIGSAKELHDKLTGKGTPEVLDAVATITGGAVGAILIAGGARWII